MAIMNPMQLIGLLRNGTNPRMIAQQLMQNAPVNSQMQGLFQMAQNGNVQGLQQYAEQYFQSQGRDFNTEMNNLMTMIGRRR